mgnify:CR=1 FL=1
MCGLLGEVDGFGGDDFKQKPATHKVAAVKLRSRTWGRSGLPREALKGGNDSSIRKTTKSATAARRHLQSERIMRRIRRQRGRPNDRTTERPNDRTTERPNDERRTTNDERRTTNDERRTTNDDSTNFNKATSFVRSFVRSFVGFTNFSIVGVRRYRINRSIDRSIDC